MRSASPLRWGVLALFFVSVGVAARGDEKPRLSTRNVVLVTTDGLRWQEVFRGAEPTLLNKENGGVRDVNALRKEFWHDELETRRETLMPFVWKTLAKKGQLIGNLDKGSRARVTNEKNFSYPGYNEMLTGSPDPRIDSNDPFDNPNVNVLEWLNQKPEFKGKVTAVTSWDLFPHILNVKRSGLPVNAGWTTLSGESLTESQRGLNRMIEQSHKVWHNCRYDAFTFPVALETLKRDKPRLLYISFGDTDEFSHQGRYDLYLEAANHFDKDLEHLWNILQSMPEYRDSTTLIVTTDHGRGDPPRAWRDHGAKVKGAEAIWIGALGPDTPALGEIKEGAEATQGQIAATVAALLGQDYRAEVPKAHPALTQVIRDTASASKAD